ncbi:MAG TPA: Na+/H+ antiporter NhaC [Flavobacteriales bacterium]|nr:Na+/H+ antiporter NhaC [Flavobacteriales bacterium]HQX28385.1 Na+/H+ antiporter NhaC [Flavobacteriales bacterium]HQX37114.1 Na+/H+ antiporter NhaC [Flavobacteriales bacterium]HQZ41856.1 Na+/H+ antiporter NhaC [Flavobacteriales bacterium]HQZ92490.1 Na+/H+ antiporter NhaC [Flavobacteriales bacterium]
MILDTPTLQRPSLLQALIPIVLLIGVLAANVIYFGEDSSYGPNQIALLVAAALAGMVGITTGRTWEVIYDGIVESISSAMGAILILLLIGALAGTWLMSGIVPAMIYYGLKILEPHFFLFASCVICSLVSLATGSSWSTVATVGIALLAIGTALGLEEGWIAGSIISGAYFGDKMSPLSDTTNLAPAVAGTDLFTHIRHMVWTTGPSMIISLLVFVIAGFTGNGAVNSSDVDSLTKAIDANFNITPMLFLVPLAVVLMIYKRMPALPALLIASLLGGLFALIYQPDIVASIGGQADNYWERSYRAIITSMAMKTSITTGNAMADDLLSAGGMSGMLNTIWLIICALTFGGVMQAVGLLRRITDGLLTMVNSAGSLIATTAGTAVFFNLTASDQYIAIVVPGKMYKEAFEEFDLAPENLSRTLEDSGTVTSVLVPWNTCGVAQSGVLGVAVWAFAPYCIFNWVSPLMTILFGYMGWKVTRLKAK